MDKVKEFKKIVNQMADTYEKKNSNYGDSFGKLFEELGAVAGLVPLYNKLHRVTSLIQGDKNHFESLEDTFIDMACYAIMNVIELRNSKAKECHSIAVTDEDDATRGYVYQDLYEKGFEPLPNYTIPGSSTIDHDCRDCTHRWTVNGCNGCIHNVILTNSNTNGGTR